MSGEGECKRRPPWRVPDDAGTVAAPPLAPGLYLVATPIGNAADVTLRALDVLGRADALACEDTRRTRTLMDMHGLSVGGRPMISYNDRNGPERRPRVMEWLGRGMSVAYASDAGTPLVSDPGYRLVEAARAGGYAVNAVPGPSAVLAALSVAGLPTDRFLFLGFLPPRSAARRRALTEVAALRATLVAFEAPHRAAETLADMAEALGSGRQGVLARELTKRFEEVRRGTLGELAAALAGEAPPRGEVVLLAGPPGEDDGAAGAAALDEALTDALARQSLKEAVREVTERLGLPRRDVYARALEISGR